MKKPSQSAKNKPGVKHRPTKGEKQKRIDTVVGLILSGTRRSEICEFARVQWGLGEAQADRYIADANSVIKIESDKAREQAFEKAVARRLKYIKQATASEDYKTALDADKDLCKLQDLYPDEKVKHSGAFQHTHLTFDVKYDDEPGADPASELHDPPAPTAPTST